jgi:protein phosphatase
MFTCPHCQSVNPQHHNFCQGCGQSLNHHICHSCGGNVDFDVESCPQCHAISGSYYWAIVELIADEGNITPVVTVANTTEIAASETNHQVEIDSSPWDLPILVSEETVEAITNKPPLVTTSGDLDTSPWDISQPLQPSPVAKDSSNNLSSMTQVDRTNGDMIDDQPLVATTYLDAQSHYRLLDPVVIQLLTPSDSCQVRVIDCQPFCNSPLEILMDQQPVTLDNNIDAVSEMQEETDPTPLVIKTPEQHRQCQFWHSHGVPKVAQAYIALQVSLPGTIPTIRDSWDDDGKTVTIVEDRHDWILLADQWNDPQIPASQVIYWLDYTLKLWVALEPWQMRQSLLEIPNLLLDEDARICFQRLYPEPIVGGISLLVENSASAETHQLQLADLAKMWKNLFDRSLVIGSAESNQISSPSLASLLQAMYSGEVERVEEVRSRLQQIAYELEPKQLSAPLQSTNSADLSNAQEAPTIALAQKLIDLEEAAATHTGKKRDHNEDCFGIVSRVDRQDSPKGKNISAQGLYILCDGMGGHAGGEIASSMTVDLLRDYFANRWGDTLPDEQTIREGIVAANEAVFEINQKNSARGSGRMGTTLVLVLVQNRDIAVAHVGDSRCYGITPTQGLIQLTLDHEVGQQQILRGVDPDIAYGRPDSYQLTQAIGPRDRNYIAPEIRFFELQEDTLILLASDGLTDNQLLENYWLTNVAPLLSPNANLQQGVDRLIDFANEYNGHDNITAMVIRAKLG